jgi:hypothetical protein
VPVQLQLPVRPGGEPVVVVAVQDDRRVGADAALRQERAELLAGRCRAARRRRAGWSSSSRRRRGCGSARRRWCRRRPRRSGRSGRRGGPSPSRPRRGRRPLRSRERSCAWVLRDRGDRGRDRGNERGRQARRSGRVVRRTPVRPTGPARDTRSGPAPSRRQRGGWRSQQGPWSGQCTHQSPRSGRSRQPPACGSRQPPACGRSARANAASRSRHATCSRWAWRTIHGSTRLESSSATVGPEGPSSSTIPLAFR